jgi:hypothetical protein
VIGKSSGRFWISIVLLMLAAISGAEFIKTPSKSKIIPFIIFNMLYFEIDVNCGKAS